MFETHTIKVSMVAQPTGKRIVVLRPGHVIDGATIVKVTDHDDHVEAETHHGDLVAFNHGQEVEALDSYRPESGGAYWVGCPTCYSVKHGGGFGPSHKASPRCQSGQHAHCTCDTCF